jgi:hypothetical protein
MGKIQLYLSLLLLLSVNLPAQVPFQAHTIVGWRKLGLWGEICLCRRCGWGRGYGCALRFMRMMTKSPGTKTTASSTSPAIPLQHNARGASSVYAADVDGDGDMDVLSAS